MLHYMRPLHQIYFAACFDINFILVFIEQFDLVSLFDDISNFMVIYHHMPKVSSNSNGTIKPKAGIIRGFNTFPKGVFFRKFT